MIHFLLIVALGLAGCASSGNASIKNQELIDQIKMGQSTKDDVRRLLGEPNSISRSSSQIANPSNPAQMLTLVEWWSYVHASTQTDAKSFIPIVGPFLWGSSHESEQFTAGFDQKGLVQHITSGSYKGKSGALTSQ
jgi:outer membrane protein assembly factor BamE (lipoprotein component of BamABCDE complex)